MISVTYKQRAFTLVEMAMVMIILGVLMGGILTGIKILQNAKVAATIGQVQTYRAAVTTFEKTYYGMPGDLPDAHKKLRGCEEIEDEFSGCELIPGGGAVTEYICDEPGCEVVLAGVCVEEVDNQQDACNLLVVNQQNTCSLLVADQQNDCDLLVAGQQNDCDVLVTGQQGICDKNVADGATDCVADGSGEVASATQISQCQAIYSMLGYATWQECITGFAMKPYVDTASCMSGLGYYSDTASCMSGLGHYSDTANCMSVNNYYTDAASCLIGENSYTDAASCLIGENNYPDVASCLIGEDSYTDTAECEADKQDEYYRERVTQAPVTGMYGDGVVGPVSWDMFTFRGTSIDSIDKSNAVDAETLLFWYELKQAGLITGVSDMGLRGSPKSKFGETHPLAEIGGGFWVGHSDGCCGAGSGDAKHPYTGRPGLAGDYSLLGNILTLVKIPTGGKEKETVFIGKTTFSGYHITNSINKNALTPVQAANIDRKLDDGFPATGDVQAFGATAACYGVEEPFVYDERETNKDCGLYIRIK